jgi:hypothetical protein
MLERPCIVCGHDYRNHAPTAPSPCGCGCEHYVPPHCPECGSLDYNATETVCLACSVRAARELES